VVPNLYLFGPQRKRIPDGMRPVATWQAVADALL
jgi:hypothetical protein